jgi:hypothetical protein
MIKIISEYFWYRLSWNSKEMDSKKKEKKF